MSGMADKPRILVVNDDGIETEGIRRLAAMAAGIGEVWVVAPDRPCSAMSHRLTLYEAMTLLEEDFPAPVAGAWRLGGTPADCVKTALGHLLPFRPDFVFSGINRGWNAGYDVAYSGTVAAAMEAVMQGVPAIAFSVEYPEEYGAAEAVLPALARELIAKDPGPGAIWNVNFPGCPAAELRGVLYERRVAPLQLYADGFRPERGEDGVLRIRQHGSRVDPAAIPEGTDLAALVAGCVSVGRLRSMVWAE